MPLSLPRLPVSAVLPDLEKVLARGPAILTAPPGSGKTTLAPLYLLAAPWLQGQKIIMLEPRRLAAQAAATYMSRLLGEPVGHTVGYRIRLERKVGPQSRIEVVTEGILTRQLQNDPGLSGVGLVIFDEFHERSLQADLGLALCLDLLALRDDLRLLVMSATLDSGALSDLLDQAPVIRAQGKVHPVTVHYLQREDQRPIATAVAAGIRRAWQEQHGDILAFLPGAREIEATARLLGNDLDDTAILLLYGLLSGPRQQAVLQPDPAGKRKIVLATAIAETSLTIEGIASVVDSGWSRLSVYQPATGLTRLDTVRVSRAAMEQRKGRAGRLGPGICYRLWTEAMEHSFPETHPPEIRSADLSTLLLELAQWGVHDPSLLRWLDPPARGPWNAASELLQQLGALDRSGHITPIGRELVTLPVHPRLGHMLLEGKKRGWGRLACTMAALLSERDILPAGEGSDIDLRLRLIERGRQDTATVQRIRTQSKVLAALCGISGKEQDSGRPGPLLCLAYPDRIARARAKGGNRYLLSSGRGARLLPDDPQRNHQLLVVPILQATAIEAVIHLSAAISWEDLEEILGSRMRKEEQIVWDSGQMAVLCWQRLLLGALVLSQRILENPDQDKVTFALCEGIRQAGIRCFGWNREVAALRQRMLLVRRKLGPPWPDVRDDALLADLDWLIPYLQGITRLQRIGAMDWKGIFRGMLNHAQQRELESLAPVSLRVPSGSHIRLNYGEDGSVVLPVRLQEMFGQAETPCICQGRVPVIVHLLSPAGRPLQVTRDLRSFWENSYTQVRKEMAGRYPRHSWPVDPWQATPTARTKKKQNPS